MITNTQSRVRYIGASDNGKVNGSFDTPSFKEWWTYKIGITDNINFDNEYTRAGTILESAVLNKVGIPAKFRNISIKPKDSAIGCNYDALQPDRVIEVKTMKIEKARNVLAGYSLPAIYKRQANHAMYVANVNRRWNITHTDFYILPLKKEDYKNPFGADLDLVFKVEYDMPDISDYIKRLNYLDMCLKYGYIPSNADFAKFCKKQLF